MSKEKVNIEQVLEEDPFKAFNLLDSPAPKVVTKKEKVEEPEIKADDLSEEEVEALEKTAKEIASTKENKIAAKKEIEKLEEEPEVIVDTNEFAGFAKFLADEGVVDLDEEEKIESENDLVKVVQKTINKGISQYKESKSEDVQKFLDFVDNGGNPADFHKYYYSDASFENFNIDKEEDQEYVITEAMTLEGYTPEEIADEITDLKDLGKLDKKAGTLLKKLQKVEKEQKQLLIEAQKEYAKEQEAKRVKEWEDFKNGLFEKETIGGFKVTPKIKTDLWDYMTKPIDRKTGVTQYQKDSAENSDARYLFAYLLKNKWDISALEKQVQTKEVSKLKATLNRYSDSNVKKTGIKDNKIVDDGSNPFEAFKKLK